MTCSGMRCGRAGVTEAFHEVKVLVVKTCVWSNTFPQVKYSSNESSSSLGRMPLVSSVTLFTDLLVEFTQPVLGRHSSTSRHMSAALYRILLTQLQYRARIKSTASALPPLFYRGQDYFVRFRHASTTNIFYMPAFGGCWKIIPAGVEY